MWAIANNVMFTEGFVLPAARSYERSEGEMGDNDHPMLSKLKAGGAPFGEVAASSSAMSAAESCVEKAEPTPARRER